MSIRLIAEVLDNAPADLTPAEVLVLVAIAEEATDATRAAWPGMAKLTRRTRLAEVSVRHVLEKLRDRGLEIRVPLSIDRNGSPVFAGRGRRTVYRLPVFSVPVRGPLEDTKPAVRGPLEDTNQAVRGPLEDTNQAVRGPLEDAERAVRRPSGDPLSLKDLLLQQACKIVKDSTDADEAEARAIVAMIRAEKNPINLIGFLTTMARDGDLPIWLDRLRRTSQHTDREDWLRQLDAMPECEHGYAGGHVPDPVGWVRCPIDRKRRGLDVA